MNIFRCLFAPPTTVARWTTPRPQPARLATSSRSKFKKYRPFLQLKIDFNLFTKLSPFLDQLQKKKNSHYRNGTSASRSFKWFWKRRAEKTQKGCKSYLINSSKEPIMFSLRQTVYNHTCVQRPPLRYQIYGRCWQVFVVQS